MADTNKITADHGNDSFSNHYETVELLKSGEEYWKLLNSLDKGFCIIQMIFDENEKPVDYRFLKVNEAFKNQTGLKDADGKRMRELEPNHEEHWFEIYGKVALTGEPARFQDYAEMLGRRWFEVQATSFGATEDRQVAVLFNDITESKNNERSSALLSAIVDSSDDAIISKNLDGIITSWNPSAERIFGYTRQEAIGQSILMLIPDELIEEENEFLAQLRKGQRIDHVETIRLHKDGTPVHVSLTNSPVKDKSGRIIGTSKVARDITEQKRTETKLVNLKDKADVDLSVMTRLHELSLRLTSTFKLQPLLEEILDASIELQNADFGSIELYNYEKGSLELFAQEGFGPDFEEFYADVKGIGTASSMALEKGMRIIIDDVKTDPRYEENRDDALQLGYQAIQATPLFNRGGMLLGMLTTYFEKPHRTSDRELRFTDLYARQAADMIDIKLSEEKLKASEEKLQSINETLEERVEERTSALLSYQNQLRSLATQLSQAEEQERHRLASDLHDNLGQLLAVCKMKINLLQKEGQESEIAEASELVDEAIRYTRELMSDLKPPPSLDDEDLKTALEWLAGKMEKHDLAVFIEDDGRSKPLTDEARTTLLRSTRELLFNVVKHADVNRVRVALKRVDGQVQVTVEDKGQGFDVEEKRSAESLDEGFGLFNIAERIDLLGGSMDIISEPGKGTKVFLTVPVLKEDKDLVDEEDGILESTPSVKAPGDARGQHKIKVLIADDHQMMREGLRKIINEEEDLTVIGEAPDGKKAVEMARETKPDIIVMDVNMPEMNGIQATQQIKAELPDMQIIGLSFHDNEDVAREMRNVGASAYLTKSDAFETLCATIRSEVMGVLNDE